MANLKNEFDSSCGIGSEPVILGVLLDCYFKMSKRLLEDASDLSVRGKRCLKKLKSHYRMILLKVSELFFTAVCHTLKRLFLFDFLKSFTLVNKMQHYMPS